MTLSGRLALAGRRSPANWRLALGALLCCLTAAATAEPFFKPFVATFSVSRGFMPLGDLELRLSLAPDGTYSYHAHTQPGLLADWFNGEEVIEESQGRLFPEGLQPTSYLYRQEVDEADNTAVRFDWAEAKAYTTSGGVTWAQPIGPDTQDRLSQQLMVRLQLAQGQQTMEYEVADGGKLKLYRFQVIGKESIKTPFGRLDCLKVARSKGSRPPEYTIWFAPRLDYLPVRIERKISGRRFVMSLDELEGIEF
jgi:hypothetical protein